MAEFSARVEQSPPVLYRVLRNKKLPITSRYYSVTTVEAEGLPWLEAKAMSERLYREEAAAKPLQTSWTHDIFFPERMDAEKSEVGYKLRKERRKRRKTVAVPRKGRRRKTPALGVQLSMVW